jgi:hypothetical protein
MDVLAQVLAIVQRNDAVSGAFEPCEEVVHLLSGELRGRRPVRLASETARGFRASLGHTTPKWVIHERALSKVLDHYATDILQKAEVRGVANEGQGPSPILDNPRDTVEAEQLIVIVVPQHVASILSCGIRKIRLGTLQRGCYLRFLVKSAILSNVSLGTTATWPSSVAALLAAFAVGASPHATPAFTWLDLSTRHVCSQAVTSAAAYREEKAQMKPHRNVGHWYTIDEIYKGYPRISSTSSPAAAPAIRLY